MKVVLDTNVLVAANGRGTTASLSCTAACAGLLLEIQTDHVLVEDTADQVFSEYKRYCNFAGQPGAGDRFFLWFIRNRWTADRVLRVDIGRNESEAAALVPSVLAGMDASDRKWVALYLQAPADMIYNAVDSDWKSIEAECSSAGVLVKEVCA